MNRGMIKGLALSFALLFVVGCNATYDEKVDYLEQVAQRGVEVHKLIEDLEEEEADEERCTEANRVLNRDRPDLQFGGSVEEREELEEEWKSLVEDVFVSACVAGRY